MSQRLVRSPEFRISFPNLVTPKAFVDKRSNKAKGDPNYNLEMIFDASDLDNFSVKSDGGGWEDTSFKQLILDVANEEWPGIDVRKEIGDKTFSWPVKSGDSYLKAKSIDSKTTQAVYAGKQVLRAKSTQDFPPRLFVVDRGEYRELDREVPADMEVAKKSFIAGFYAIANLNAKANEYAGVKYVTLYLNAVLFSRKGDRIGGFDANDRFGGIKGGASDYDPTGGMDDEIPF